MLALLVVTATVSACARPAPMHTRAVMIDIGCPSQRPASWPNSQFRVSLGGGDSTLDAQTGALIFEVRIDSVPGEYQLKPQSAQVSLWNQTIRRDAAYGDSLIRIAAPAGRYSFRARSIAAQTLQDSIDVRGGYVDTVKVTLGRDIVCILSPMSPPTESPPLSNERCSRRALVSR
jgi:hypothetical protein